MQWCNDKQRIQTIVINTKIIDVSQYATTTTFLTTATMQQAT